MSEQIIKIAKKVINTEIKGLKTLSKKIDKSFVKAINVFKKIKGKVIVTGVGKSGIIAKKVASTLASTGSPAQFVHSTEASHGDLGVVDKKDAILAFTFSGKTIELNDIFIYAKEKKIPLIIITGKSNSKLKNVSTACIEISNLKEEPRSSSTEPFLNV